MSNATPEDDEPEWMNSERALVDACLRHGVWFFWRGPGTFLIDKRGASKVLDDVLSAGFELLGLEAFEFEDLTIHPRIDLIYVAEWSPGTAHEALAQWGDDIWVDFNIVSRDIRER